MKYSLFLFFIAITFPSSSYGQTTVEPNSLTIGVDSLSQITEDTILYWRKSHGAMRGGYFQSGDISSSNTGAFSLAYGVRNTAIGYSSIALGSSNESIGDNSATLGTDLIVNDPNTVAVGISNANIAANSNRLLRPIFVVGNGDKTSGRSNAMTVIMDGRTGINTETPMTDLHLVHKNASDFAGLRIENEEGQWWRFYTRSLTDNLALYNNSFMGGTSAVGEFNTSGSYSGPSDRRLKKDIVELPYGLADVLKLSPKRYQFKHVADRLDIGLIAQDVMEVIPELVSYDEKEDKYMMNYDGFGVLAIKALQELSEIVEKQQVLIDKLIEQNKK